jgi:hypothetical protein
MDISEVQKEKANLERSIGMLVAKFESETNTRVASIYVVELTDDNPSGSRTWVKVEVKI